jgi:hypothetical protein
MITEKFGPYADETDVNGAFGLATEGGVRTTLRAEYDDYYFRPTLLSVPLENNRASGIVLPIQDRDEFDLELLNAGILSQDATSTVVIFLRNNGLPVTGGTVEPAGAGGTPPYYDVGSPLYWDSAAGGTGELGAALISSLPFGIGAIRITATYNGTSKDLT